MRGGSLVQVANAGLASFCGIATLGATQHFLTIQNANVFPSVYLAALGSTAAIMAAFPSAPFSQPKNVILSHTMGSAVGVTCALIEPDILAGPTAVSLTVMAMIVTKTFHPPAGGTALFCCQTIAASPVIASSGAAASSYELFGFDLMNYMLVPSFFVSSSLLVSCAWLFGDRLGYPAPINKTP